VSQCQLHDLQLDYVEVSLGRVEEIEGLHRFVALGAKEMMVHVWQLEFNGFYPPLSLKKVRSSRVESVSVTYNVNVSDVESDIVNFPYSHLYSVISAISEACPKCRRIVLRFKLPGEFTEEEDFNHVINWLRTTSLQLVEARSRMQCGNATSVVMAFRAFFPERKLRQVRDGEEYALGDLGVEDHDEWEEDYDYAGGSIPPESMIIARRLVVPFQSQGQEVDSLPVSNLTMRCFLVGMRDDEDFNNDHQVGPPAQRFEIGGYDDTTLLDEMDEGVELSDGDGLSDGEWVVPL